MKNKKGFSLAEVLMVTVFISIMSAVTITSLNASRTRKQVEVTVREVAAAIREAQNGALTGKKTDDTHLPCRYEFERVNDSQYKITYYFHVGPSTNCASSLTPQTLADYTTKNSVTVGSFNTITFGVPFANISGLSSNPMSIVVSKGGVSYAVCVSSSGNVWEESDGTCS